MCHAGESITRAFALHALRQLLDLQRLVHAAEHNLDAAAAGAGELHIAHAHETLPQRLVHIDVAQVLDADGFHLARDESFTAFDGLAVDGVGPLIAPVNHHGDQIDKHRYDHHVNHPQVLGGEILITLQIGQNKNNRHQEHHADLPPLVQPCRPRNIVHGFLLRGFPLGLLIVTGSEVFVVFHIAIIVPPAAGLKA